MKSLIFGLATLMGLNNIAYAQSLRYNYGGQSFSSKGAAEAAMYARSDSNKLHTIEEVKSRNMTSWQYLYSAPEKPRIVDEYNGYATGFAGSNPRVTTEQEALDKTIQYYEDLLLERRCTDVLSHQIVLPRSSWVDQHVSYGIATQQKGVPKYTVTYKCDTGGQTTDIDFVFNMYRSRPVYCPMYYHRFNRKTGNCEKPGQIGFTGSLNSKNCGRGNPCIPATGDKYQVETDYSQTDMVFVRSFHTQSSDHRSGLGAGWTHNFAQRIALRTAGSNQGVYIDKNGFHVPIRFSNEAQAFLPFDGKSEFSIKKENDLWVMQRGSSERRIFSLDGDLIQIQNNQHTIDVNRDTNGRLLDVQNSYGHSLSFGYDGAGRINQLTTPQGETYIYEYSESNNLLVIIYPDNTLPLGDNQRRQYHYEDERFPKYLTGITDENGDRYATYAYDANGLAISTEHAQTTNSIGQEKFELDYQGAN